jgi:hypothetical protein
LRRRNERRALQVGSPESQEAPSYPSPWHCALEWQRDHLRNTLLRSRIPGALGRPLTTNVTAGQQHHLPAVQVVAHLPFQRQPHDSRATRSRTANLAPHDRRLHGGLLGRGLPCCWTRWEGANRGPSLCGIDLLLQQQLRSATTAENRNIHGCVCNNDTRSCGASVNCTCSIGSISAIREHERARMLCLLPKPQSALAPGRKTQARAGVDCIPLARQESHHYANKTTPFALLCGTGPTRLVQSPNGLAARR